MYRIYMDGTPMNAYEKKWKAQAEVMNLRTLHKGMDITMRYEEI